MKKLFLSCLLAVFLSLAMAGTASASWIWAGSDDKVGIFFKPESVVFEHQGNLINGDVVYVWWYMLYDDAYAQSHPYMGKTLKKIVLYDKLNLEKVMSKNLDATAYDDHGDVIYRGSDERPTRIIPGSHQEVLFNAVAKYVDEHLEEVNERTVK